MTFYDDHKSFPRLFRSRSTYRSKANVSRSLGSNTISRRIFIDFPIISRVGFSNGEPTVNPERFTKNRRNENVYPLTYTYIQNIRHCYIALIVFASYSKIRDKR